jgi:hypothetical protein
MTTRTASAADTAHATPESGIIWVYHFAPDGTAELVANEVVGQAIASQPGWTWVHLSLADTRCRKWIEHSLLIWSWRVRPCSAPMTTCASS